MKNCITYFICLSFFFAVGCQLSRNTEYEILQSEQAVNVVLEQTTPILKKRYKMDPIATNVAMPGGVIKLLGLDFQIVGPIKNPRSKLRGIHRSATRFFTKASAECCAPPDEVSGNQLPCPDV